MNPFQIFDEELQVGVQQIRQLFDEGLQNKG
jgi:hypothetical protein